MVDNIESTLHGGAESPAASKKKLLCDKQGMHFKIYNIASDIPERSLREYLGSIDGVHFELVDDGLHPCGKHGTNALVKLVHCDPKWEYKHLKETIVRGLSALSPGGLDAGRGIDLTTNEHWTKKDLSKRRKSKLVLVQLVRVRNAREDALNKGAKPTYFDDDLVKMGEQVVIDRIASRFPLVTDRLVVADRKHNDGKEENRHRVFNYYVQFPEVELASEAVAVGKLRLFDAETYVYHNGNLTPRDLSEPVPSSAQQYSFFSIQKLEKPKWFVQPKKNETSDGVARPPTTLPPPQSMGLPGLPDPRLAEAAAINMQHHMQMLQGHYFQQQMAMAGGGQFMGPPGMAGQFRPPGMGMPPGAMNMMRPGMMGFGRVDEYGMPQHPAAAPHAPAPPTGGSGMSSLGLNTSAREFVSPSEQPHVMGKIIRPKTFEPASPAAASAAADPAAAPPSPTHAASTAQAPVGPPPPPAPAAAAAAAPILADPPKDALNSTEDFQATQLRELLQSLDNDDDSFLDLLKFDDGGAGGADSLPGAAAAAAPAAPALGLPTPAPLDVPQQSHSPPVPAALDVAAAVSAETETEAGQDLALLLTEALEIPADKSKRLTLRSAFSPEDVWKRVYLRSGQPREKAHALTQLAIAMHRLGTKELLLDPEDLDSERKPHALLKEAIKLDDTCVTAHLMLAEYIERQNHKKLGSHTPESLKEHAQQTASSIVRERSSSAAMMRVAFEMRREKADNKAVTHLEALPEKEEDIYKMVHDMKYARPEDKAHALYYLGRIAEASEFGDIVMDDDGDEILTASQLYAEAALFVPNHTGTNRPMVPAKYRLAGCMSATHEIKWRGELRRKEYIHEEAVQDFEALKSKYLDETRRAAST